MFAESHDFIILKIILSQEVNTECLIYAYTMHEIRARVSALAAAANTVSGF